MFTQILHRPALAIVLAIIIVLLGSLGIASLPIAQFPDIAPPTVYVSIAYPGASAKVLTDSVLIPLEQSINGVQNMRYIVSDATSAGEATIRIFFEPGTDPNINVVNVQNRVNIMTSRLPELVVREGILVSQVVPSMLMYLNLYSTDPNTDQKDLFNYAQVYIMPVLKRIKGMGIPVNLGNRTFAMRIWLNPERMRAYNVSVDDVMKALATQSIIGSPGRLGQATGMTSQSKEYVLTYIGRFNEPEQYANIILKAMPDGEILRLKDVCVPPLADDSKGAKESHVDHASVELGSEFFDIYSDVNGHPAASIVLKQAPGSNAAEVIAEVKKTLEELKPSFPPGMDYEIAYDVSRFVEASIEQVLHTLVEAFILVSLVVYLFLGDVRSTIIPVLAVPVSLIGSFFVLQLMGFSINLITLFCHGLGHRCRRRQCHRGGRGRARQNGRDAPVTVSGHHRSAQGDQRRDHRNHTGHERRVCSGDLSPGAGRRVLPPVWRDDGFDHRPFRRGCLDAYPSAVCHGAEASFARARWRGGAQGPSGKTSGDKYLDAARVRSSWGSRSWRVSPISPMSFGDASGC